MDIALFKFVTIGIRVWIVTITIYVTFRESVTITIYVTFRESVTITIYVTFREPNST
jgi:hypothetical protein